MKQSAWEKVLYGNLRKINVFAFFLSIILFPGLAWTSDQVLPRTGQVSLTQIDQYLQTPIGPTPITRIFDQDQESGILGPGWALDLNSQVLESEGNLILLSPSTGPIFLFQKEKGKLYEGSYGILARVKEDGWIVESPGGPTSFFDRRGKELSRRDANGNTITFSYDNRGFLSAAKAVDGQSLRFTYNAKGLLVSIQGPSGRQCGYHYDPRGRLTEVMDADGWTTRFTYSEGGRLSAIDYASGESVRFKYDGSGRVAERASSTGITYTYSYAAATRVSRQDGFWSEISYDKRRFAGKIPGKHEARAELELE